MRIFYKVFSYIGLSLFLMVNGLLVTNAASLPDLVPTSFTCEKNVLGSGYAEGTTIATFDKGGVEYVRSCGTTQFCEESDKRDEELSQNNNNDTQKEIELEEGGEFVYVCDLTVENKGADIPANSWVNIGFKRPAEFYGAGNSGFPINNGLRTGESISHSYDFRVQPQEVLEDIFSVEAHINQLLESASNPREDYLSKFYAIARDLSGIHEDGGIVESDYTNNTIAVSFPLGRPAYPDQVGDIHYISHGDTVRAIWDAVDNVDYYKVFVVYGAGEVQATSTMYRTTDNFYDVLAPSEGQPLHVSVWGINQYGSGKRQTKEYPYYKPVDVFKDVDKGQWYADYVMEAFYDGVVSGYKDSSGKLLGKYGPGDNVTVAELTKIITSSSGIPIPDDTSLVPEKYKGHWGASLLNWLIKNDNYLVKYDENPDRPATREEILRFVLEQRYLTSDTLRKAIESPEGMAMMSYAFPDIDTENKVFIQIGYDFGIVDGYPDGTFKPKKPVNRAEMAKILRLARGGDLRSSLQ